MNEQKVSRRFQRKHIRDYTEKELKELNIKAFEVFGKHSDDGKVPVRFRCYTQDHTGYCSGEDADFSMESAILSYRTYMVPETLFVSGKIPLFFSEGCTSNGSGYCKNMGTLLVPIYGKNDNVEAHPLYDLL
jgi:hypothetical protein